MNTNTSQNKKITDYYSVGPIVWTELPECPNWSKARNGGDYAFGYREILKSGKPTGARLSVTSSDISYCTLGGRFERDTRYNAYLGEFVSKEFQFWSIKKILKDYFGK